MAVCFNKSNFASCMSVHVPNIFLSYKIYVVKTTLVSLFVILYSHYTCTFKTTLLKKLTPMIERVPLKPTLVIVLTIMLSELSAILMNFIHLLENHNSGSITPVRCGNKLQWVVQGPLHTLRIAILHEM